MKEFLIKKDKHYSKGLHLGITFKGCVSFDAYFDKTCLYDLGDSDNYDINKLYGFSTTLFHHNQSARVGWRCLDGKNIELLTYSYNNGERSIGESDLLGVVKPNELFTCSIIDTEKEYIYIFERESDEDELIVRSDPKQKDWFLFHRVLFPYFGGNKVAPHNMKMYLKRRKIKETHLDVYYFSDF